MSLVHHFKLNFAKLVFHKAKKKYRRYAKISAIIEKSGGYSFQKLLADDWLCVLNILIGCSVMFFFF